MGNKKPARSRFFVNQVLKSSELEQCKAKAGKEAECTFVHEHSEPVFNAAVPTRSRLSLILSA